MQKLKLIQALLNSLASQHSDLSLLEQGLDCLELYIEKGEESKRQKRIAELVELDVMEVYEKIEKSGGVK